MRSGRTRSHAQEFGGRQGSQHAIHPVGEFRPAARQLHRRLATAVRQTEYLPWVAYLDLDPAGLDPLGAPKSPEDGIYDPLDHLDTRHLLQTTANLRPIEGSIPQAREDSQVETALAEL